MEGYSLGPEPQRRIKPSNGTTIMVVGILGLVMLQIILGPVAWVMANNSLREIRSGRMDDSDEGMIKVGRVLGIIATTLGIISLLAAIAYVLFYFRFFSLTPVRRLR